MANDDDEMNFRRDHGVAIGSDAVTIAAPLPLHAQEALDKIPRLNHEARKSSRS